MIRRAAVSRLIARPIAHRGLHDAAAGIVENTPSAVQRAIRHGYGIEVDLQRTGDGRAVVFHDDMLDRLTLSQGPVAARTLAELRTVEFRNTADRFWTVEELLDEVDGQVALVVELKSRFDGDVRLAGDAAAALATYPGLIGIKSFDPDLVAAFRAARPDIPRGVVGCAFEADDAEWAPLSALRRAALRHLAHWPRTRPDFLSWDVHDLDRPALNLARLLTNVPLMAWTVRTGIDQAKAGLRADQMIFEGFLP